jgi:OmpA family
MAPPSATTKPTASAASTGKVAVTKREEDRVERTTLHYDFDIDDARMKPDHGKLLADVIELTKANPKAKIKLRGSASKSGDRTRNQDLSRDRARALEKYLVEEKGVNRAQVETTWTGSDKSTSALVEDERDRAVEVTVTAPITVDRISFWNDLWTRELKWDDIIGMDEAATASPGVPGIAIANVNVEVEASGAPEPLMPKSFTVRLRSSVPGREGGGNPTLTTPYEMELPRVSHRLGTERHEYRLSIPLASVGQFLAWSWGKALEVALVVRKGGTSDGKFRSRLGNVAFRGRGVQAYLAGNGSEDQQVPDGKRLLLAGGVEVLTAEVAAMPGVDVAAKPAARLVRSPADVVYYSGHGLGKEGCLALEDKALFHGASVDGYTCWLGPDELVAYWKKPFDVSILIIAGCAVLDLDRNGKAWTKLLKSKGGPLDVILGYEDGGPDDSRGGNAIAEGLAEAVTTAGSTSEDLWVRSWLYLNGTRSAWNAVAFTSRGRWWIKKASWASRVWHHRVPGTSDEVPFSPSDIVGPEPIP